MQPWVIGIAGGSGSGKSTLARAVRDALGDEACGVLQHDAYYRPLPPDADLSVWNFDHPDALETDLLAEHLAALRAGRPAAIPDYCLSTHARRGTRTVEPRRVLVVEGVLLLTSPEVRAQLDLTVFVDTDEATRLHRRIARDQAERARLLPDILRQYFHSVRPMHEAWVAPCRERAAIVVDGTADLSQNVARILARAPTR